MITIGTKVAILPCDDYRNRFIGTQGIVQKYYHNKVGVKIDGCKNPESEFGVTLVIFLKTCMGKASSFLNILMYSLTARSYRLKNRWSLISEEAVTSE